MHRFVTATACTLTLLGLTSCGDSGARENVAGRKLSGDTVALCEAGSRTSMDFLADLGAAQPGLDGEGALATEIRRGQQTLADALEDHPEAESGIRSGVEGLRTGFANTADALVVRDGTAFSSQAASLEASIATLRRACNG